jgi:hypothetical protein
LYIGSAPTFTSKLNASYNLTSIPAGAQLAPTGTVFVELDTYTGSTLDPPDIDYKTPTNALLGTEVDISLGPNYTPIGTALVQSALNAHAASFTVYGSIATQSWTRLAAVPLFGAQATAKLKYSLEVPDAGEYHTVPLYDGSWKLFTDGSPAVVDTSDIYLGATQGFEPSQRLAAEFALSTVPAGTRITKATLEITGQFDFLPGSEIAKGVDFFGFAGSGSPGAAPPATTKLIAVSGQVGRNRSYQVSLDPTYVESLLGTGQTLGLLGRPNLPGSGGYLFGSSEDFRSKAPELILEFGSAAPEPYEMNFSPATDAQVTINASSSVSVDPTSMLNVQTHLADGSEQRGLMEFDTRPLVFRNSVIQANLSFDVALFDSGAAGFPAVSVYAYAGDGLLDATDSNNLGMLVGTSGAVTSLGLVEMELDKQLIQQLLLQSDYIGLVIVGSNNGQRMLISSADQVSSALPTLTILTIPEPATVSLCVASIIGALVVRRRWK